MSSNNKTQNLRLNLWDGSDKPKRADFNYDNTILENIISSHLNDTTVHFASGEKDSIANPFVISTYIGNGANARLVSLSFQPRFLFIFANNMPLSVYDSTDDKMLVYAGAVAGSYHSPGITITEEGLNVVYTPNNPSIRNYYPMFNENAVKYTYIALK